MSPRNKKLAIIGAALLGLLLLLVIPSRPSGVAPPQTTARADVSAVGEESSSATKFNRKTDSKVRPEDIPAIDIARISDRPAIAPNASRDLFRFKEPPPRPPPPPVPPAPKPILAGDPRFIGALPLPPPPPPPVPPAIPFQFTGTFGSARSPIAVIVEGDRLSVVRKGDVVNNRFIIRRVGYESLDIGFVGFPETETRRLPIKSDKS
jgi:hypothetical protein